ncbi:MAG: hypothetical protein CMO34_06850 [Verrucomicrobia bacterium]|nr:hypothetical protein [Verrucomicrobiota bacterium]
MLTLLLRLSLFLFIGSFSFQLYATHIVGGYLSYQFISSTVDSAEYELTLFLYKDCGPNANVINEAAVYAIFDQNFVQVHFDSLPRISIDTLEDNINNPCVVSVPDVCVAEEIYRGRIRVDRSQGHTITYQRCCRNGTIDNIVDPGSQGSTYSAFIPAFDLIGANSTPDFGLVPPIVLCSNFEANFDLSVTDADGDSLVYSLCSPYNYASISAPRPNNSTNPVQPPPYFPLLFTFPQTAENPIPSNPQIRIDSTTGKLTGLPSLSNEQYVLGFCVQEFRNGVLINTVRRGIQLNTGNCNPVIVTAVQDQTQFCDGLNVLFRNNSTANVNVNSYKWDFGVPGVLDDTSRIEDSVEFTYPSPGIYTITLIANPDFPCSDTSTSQFEVRPELNPTIEQTGVFCEDSNGVSFDVGGVFSPTTSFRWQFGSDASIGSSTQKQVSDVKYSNAGSKQVSLVATEGNCKDSLVDGFRIYRNPTADFIFSDSLDCSPMIVDFQNLSRFEGTAEFEWDFGDGNKSNLRDPQHTYLNDGLYDVQMKIKTTSLCVDSITITKPNAIRVTLDASPNVVDFQWLPNEGCVPLEVQFMQTSSSVGTPKFIWDLDNNVQSELENPTSVYTDTGYYSIGLIMITEGKCADTLNMRIDSAIRVYFNPISSFTVSDSALPLKEANFFFDGQASQFVDKSHYELNGINIGVGPLLNYSFMDTGHFNIDYIVENQFNCLDTSSQTVLVFDEFELKIPNVFTPNYDNVNDRFEIEACGIYDFRITIHNRYGQQVFESTSLNFSWDGRINGKRAHPGVYFYDIDVLDFKGERKNYQGSVTIINR